MLTQKQEAFVAKYLECDRAADAYRYAYSTENMSSKTINNEAYDLTLHPEIAPIIKKAKDKVLEQIEKILDKASIDKAYVTKRILYNLNMAETQRDPSVALKGLDMLGKMYDLNEDKQNDRLVSMKDKQALVENYKRRMLDVTPEEA